MYGNIEKKTFIDISIDKYFTHSPVPTPQYFVTHLLTTRTFLLALSSKESGGATLTAVDSKPSNAF